MKRRNVLGLIAGAGVLGGTGIAAGGTFFRPNGNNDDENGELEVKLFELVEPELAAEDPPEITVDGDVVDVRGTVGYESSSCGTVELDEVEYDQETQHLDVLVSHALESDDDCTDDVARSGYEAAIKVNAEVTSVTATELHFPFDLWDEETSETIELND